MIKIFNPNETDFSTNGIIAINPLKCIETKKKSLNGWFIDVEIPIKYIEYIKQDYLCVIKTKSKLNPQAFFINNISYSTKTIKFTAEHIFLKARDYFLLDCRPTNLDGNNALNYINERTDNVSPFNIVSNVETINTSYFIRKNLLQAWENIESKWGGTFDFDNYTVYFMNNVGSDNGEIVAYGKNMQSISIYEDWSNVVTKLCPVGFDGTLLPEKYLISDVIYNKPYTKCIQFESDLEGDDRTEEALIQELRLKATDYLLENQYPKVSYEISSNIIQTVDIGDIIHVKHPLVTLKTEVQEYEYDVISNKVKKLIFGNYNRDVKAKFDAINSSINETFNKLSKQEQVINNQTDIINNLNKKGIVYIDDNEILILDSVPKEQAKNILRLGLGGLGISDNGIEGPFKTAITPSGINADFITSGTISTSRIEGYGQLVSVVNSTNQKIEDGLSNVNSTLNNYQQTTESKFEQTNNQFNTSLSVITETIDAKDNATNNRINEINNYIRYALENNVGVVTIGTSDSPIKLKVKNDRISFEQNNIEVAYISNNTLYITDATFLNSLRIGNFAFIPRANGSLGFKKVVS